MTFRNEVISPFGPQSPYTFVQANLLPTPGARDKAYMPQFSLPGDALQGRGIVYNGGTTFIGTLQEAPGYSLQAPRVDGINGIVYAGAQLQGLIDPEAMLLKAKAG